MTDINNVDRSVMVRTPLKIFLCDGFWCPLSWSPKWKYIYRCYTIFTFSLLVSFMISQFVYILNIKNVTELATNFLTFIPTVNAFCKAVNIVFNSQKMIHLLRMLDQDCCKGRDQNELNIQRKYEILSKWINTIIAVNTIVTLECMVFSSLMTNLDGRRLPFLSWTPYKVDTEIKFWLTFTWEGLSATVVGLANLANDLLTISIMMQISGQLDILVNRVLYMAKSDLSSTKQQSLSCTNKYKNEQEHLMRMKLAHCVQHHLFIFELSEATQRCLVPTFAVQMLVSIIGTCTGAYQLAGSTIGSPEFTSGCLYVGCMVSEAFLYCWFGNEVHLKSLGVADAVYHMDWTSLKIDMQRNLLNICMRARNPIIFTSGPAMPLSNEVFVGILQASYSAYTVLRELGKSSST